jgi:TldD protein
VFVPSRGAYRLRPHRRSVVAQSEEAARQARAIADQASTSAVAAVGSQGVPHDLYTLAEPPLATDLDRKVKLLGSVDAAARALDPRVRQVIATLGSEDVIVLMATPAGWTVGDVRPLTRLNVTVIVEDNGKREIGTYGAAGAWRSISAPSRSAGRFASKR